MDHEALLSHYGFHRIRRMGDEIRATCPFCGSPQKFWFNVDRNLGICFRGCFAGTLEALIARLEGCDITEAQRLLGERTDWHSTLMAKLRKRVEGSRRREPFVLPALAPLPPHAVEYFRGRRISPGLLERYGAGTCPDVVGLAAAFWDCSRDDAAGILTLWPAKGAFLAARAIFPVMRAGEAVCAEARTVVAGVKPKALYPQGVDQKVTLYGLPFALGSDYVVIVEGIPGLLSVVGWGFPAVATLSAGVAPEQAAELLRHFRRVYFAYDADKGGRAGLRYSLRTLDDGLPVYVLELPEGKDPNDVDRATFAAAFSGARRLPVGHRLDREGNLRPLRCERLGGSCAGRQGADRPFRR